MVEGTGLENRHTCKGIESSNLSLSVSHRNQKGPRFLEGLFSFVIRTRLLIEDVDPGARLDVERHNLVYRYARS